jgi:hypothetical protein
VESVQVLPNTSTLGAFQDRIGAKRGRHIGVVAAARKQIGYVDYALRDHHARSTWSRVVCLLAAPSRTHADVVASGGGTDAQVDRSVRVSMWVRRCWWCVCGW